MTQDEINFFNALAPTWDQGEIRSTPRRVNAILDIIGVSSGSRVLDLGAGTGVLIPYLTGRVGPDGAVVAVDASPAMLSIARGKFGTLRGVTFSNADFESDPVDGRFDLIMLYSVYPHLHEPAATLRKLATSNLAAGGRIVIAFPSDHHFINSIHAARKAPGEGLPPAPELARRLAAQGFTTSVLADTPDAYIVTVELRIRCRVSGHR